MKLQRTLLVILLLCLALPSLAAAEQDDFAVEPLEDGGVAITRYRGKVHKLTVPDRLDGQTVTAVRAGAFCDLDVLESVALPDSIVTVEDGAFSRCDALESVRIPERVSNLGNTAFSYCHALKSAEIAAPVETLPKYLFFDCTALESVILPDGLTALTLPESVCEIGKDAFADCPVTLTVERDSPAAQYAESARVPYTYPNANDWLND